MTTGPAGRHWMSADCGARSLTAVHLRRSGSAGAGSSSGPTPGSTTSADCAAAPNGAATASTPTSPWPPRRHPPRSSPRRLVPLPLEHPTEITTHPLTYWRTLLLVKYGRLLASPTDAAHAPEAVLTCAFSTNQQQPTRRDQIAG